VLAALAHNLLRWTQLLGLPDTTTQAARTLCRRLLSIPGRVTRHARGWTCTCPPAGRGTATTSTRSTASARSPPPPDATTLSLRSGLGTEPELELVGSKATPRRG
jgi:hypothetical protein